MKVGFIGLGKLGLTCAQVMATKYSVTGYDINKVVSDSVQVVDTVEAAVRDRDLIFVAVPTPHHPQYGGEAPTSHLEPRDFDYTVVQQVLDQINVHLHDQQLVVLISTVLPGTVRRTLAERITRGRFIYNPYLIAMGSIAWDMVNPEMIIIGTKDGNIDGDARTLIDFYDTLVRPGTRYEVGTWDEAESIKIFYNTFISTKIGLVNMIQDVAVRCGNIDVDVVTGALARSTHRITGPAYMRAGMGDSGGCHPRDNIALRWLSQHLELDYDLFGAIMGARESQARNIALKLVELARQWNHQHIWIHGRAFKPGVPYTEGSYSELIAHYVRENNFQVHYVDPLTGDIHDSIGGVVLLAHHAPTTYANTNTELRHSQAFYAQIQPGSVVLDPWRWVTADMLPHCTVISWGNTRNTGK